MVGSKAPWVEICDSLPREAGGVRFGERDFQLSLVDPATFADLSNTRCGGTGCPPAWHRTW
jgi:hypothetical protein